MARFTAAISTICKTGACTLGAAALFASLPAAAQSNSQNNAETRMPQMAQEAADTAAEKKVCRNERMTGSLTRVRRTCMTQREWDALAAGTRDSVDRFNREVGRQPAATGSGGPPGM